MSRKQAYLRIQRKNCRKTSDKRDICRFSILCQLISCSHFIYLYIKHNEINMQQQYQILNLHSIIKTQDSKIQELRHELRIANERQQQRYGQLSKQTQLKQNEKDKVIEYLKSEVQKARQSKQELREEEKQKTQRKRVTQDKQIIQYKKRIIELEGKVKRIQNDSNQKIQQLFKMSEDYKGQVQRHQQNRTTMMLEVSKLNYFYKNSMFDISKRKETLLWVQKFTEFLEHAQKREDKTLSEVNNYVKGEVESIRTHFSKIVKQYSKYVEETSNIKSKSYKELDSMLCETKKTLEEIVKQNEQYWMGFIREQKNSQKTAQINRLKEQLKQQKYKHNVQIQKLKNQLKVFEGDKKSLMMGFQQLKNLNEGRQSNYKQEIRFLKQTIQQLLETGEQRDKDFEQQIKTLTNQIQLISQKYYQNIEYPINKVNEKFNDEVEKVKVQLHKLNQNSFLKNSFEKFERVMKKYVQRTSTYSYKDQIYKYIETSTDLLSQLHEKMMDNKLQDVEHEQNEELKLVQMRQKLNKAKYEVILNKKHLERLQQYVKELEKKSTRSIDKNMSRKVIQLESQNQALRQSLDLLKQSNIEDLTSLKNKYFMNASEKGGHTFNVVLIKLKQTNERLLQYIKEDQNHFVQVKKSLNVINSLLLKPTEAIQFFAKEVAEVGSSSRINLSNRSRQSATITQRTGNFQQISKYKNILLKRTQNNNNTCRIVGELIRTLRQNFRETKNKQKQVEGERRQHQQENNKKRERGTERKIKQIQNQRIKDKQQSIQKIQKLQKYIHSLQVRLQKQPSLQTNLLKFEQQFERKINEMIEKTRVKIDKSSIRQIKQEVIKDLRIKLNQANLQSQGLRKELTLLHNSKQI